MVDDFSDMSHFSTCLTGFPKSAFFPCALHHISENVISSQCQRSCLSGFNYSSSHNPKPGTSLLTMEKERFIWVPLVPSFCKVGNGFVPGPFLVGFGALHLAEKHALETNLTVTFPSLSIEHESFATQRVPHSLVEGAKWYGLNGQRGLVKQKLRQLALVTVPSALSSAAADVKAQGLTCLWRQTDLL